MKNLYWLVPSLLVAIGGIATFIRWIIKKPKPSVESIQQTASPSLTQTANPNITQHVIVHPPSQYEEPKPQQAPAPVPTRTIKVPNIIFLRTRTAIVAGSSLENVLTANISHVNSFEERTFLPAPIREYQIRYSRFGSSVWLARFELTAMGDNNETQVQAVFPHGTAGNSTTGWLQLNLE